MKHAQRKAFFPFSLPDDFAMALAEKDNEYRHAIENQARIARVTRLEIHGTVNADKTMNIWAWACCSGFAQTAGKFWEKTSALPDETFNTYVEHELQRRALMEIEHEELLKLKVRLDARIALLRKDLLEGKS